LLRNSACGQEKRAFMTVANYRVRSKDSTDVNLGAGASGAFSLRGSSSRDTGKRLETSVTIPTGQGPFDFAVPALRAASTSISMTRWERLGKILLGFRTSRCGTPPTRKRKEWGRSRRGPTKAEAENPQAGRGR